MLNMQYLIKLKIVACLTVALSFQVINSNTKKVLYWRAVIMHVCARSYGYCTHN